MISLSGTPVLETDRLILRAPQASDWEPYCAYVTSDRATAARGMPESRESAFRYFTSFVGIWVVRGFGRFVITARDSGATLGHTGPLDSEENPETELTWTLWSASDEGKGLASEAALAARDWCRSALGLERMVSYIAPHNTPSAALALRLGAIHERSDDFGWGPVDIYRHPAAGGAA